MQDSTVFTTQFPWDGEAPAWFLEDRQDAWEQFQAIEMPNHLYENWRYGSLKTLASLAKCTLAPVLPTEVEFEAEESEGEACLCLCNGFVSGGRTALPEGVTVSPLSEVLESPPDWLKGYLSCEKVNLGSTKFEALNRAQRQDGLIVHVPEGIILKKPIRVQHYVGGESGAVFPYTLVVCEKGAEVVVIESYEGETEHDNFVVAVTDVVAKEESTVKYALMQNLGLNDKMLHLNNLHVEKSAHAYHLIVNAGGAWVREEVSSRLLAPEAKSEVLSASIVAGQQVVDQRTYQHHLSAHTASDLLYKNTLFDKSKTTFSGMITVEDGAHFTDAYQTCRNLILSEDAETNSLPGLEILADQVKCSHGTANSTISEEELFYLLSRGISEDVARKMIALGFNTNVIERFENEDVQELALSLIQLKFSSIMA